jgi:hypothetical protein
VFDGFGVDGLGHKASLLFIRDAESSFAKT